MAKPQIDRAFYGSVEEYVKARGGNRPIKKVSGYAATAVCCVN